MADDRPWYRTRRGPPVVALYALLTVTGIALSTGWLVGPGFFEPSSDSALPTTAIPPFVYLYGFLGGMVYAFTSIVAKFERGLTGVARVGLRALAAMPLAAGVFLLAGLLGTDPSNGRLVAGLAFLAGLYVNLTLKGLGGLAERLLGVTSSDDDSAGDSPESGTK